MTEQALVPSQQHSALDVYGAGEDILTFAKRIKLYLPNGDKLSEPEAMALSQLSMAYRLNPFNGEAWYIPGKGPMVGIKGLRKAARKQGLYWAEHILLTPQERTELAIPDGAIAYKCLIYRADIIRQSAEAIKMMYDAGMKDAAERYGYKPTVGIGYCAKGEATKMKPDQAARKRAEADALKVAFDLPFATDVGNGNRVGYVDDLEAMDTAIDGEYRQVDQDRVERTSRALYGDPDFEGFEVVKPVPATPGIYLDEEPEAPKATPAKEKATRPYPADQVRRRIRGFGGWVDINTRKTDGEAVTEKQVPLLAGKLGEAVKPSEGVLSSNETDQRRHAILMYLVGVESVKSLTKKEASAMLDWLTVPDGVDLNEWANRECASVYAAFQVEAGQQVLPLEPPF